MMTNILNSCIVDYSIEQYYCVENSRVLSFLKMTFFFFQKELRHFILISFNSNITIDMLTIILSCLLFINFIYYLSSLKQTSSFYCLFTYKVWHRWWNGLACNNKILVLAYLSHFIYDLFSSYFYLLLSSTKKADNTSSSNLNIGRVEFRR
jgi:hypothetical protein